MKVLVCGSKDWTDAGAIEREFKKLPAGSTIVHGAGPGAEAIADKLAMKYGFSIKRYSVEEDDGKSSSSNRNSVMIRSEHVSGNPINLGLAFTSDLSRSRVAKDCVERAKKAGIKVNIISG